jgi:hypothetical protein
MNWPAIAAIWLIPSAKPRWSAGKASVRRRRVRRQHGTADGLQRAPADEPQRAVAAVHRVEREQHRRDAEHGESRVVDADSAEDVTQTPEADDEHGLHQPVAHDHPQQKRNTAGRQRIELDAAKIAGSAMITMDPSSADMNTASVVFERAIQR